MSAETDLLKAELNFFTAQSLSTVRQIFSMESPEVETFITDEVKKFHETLNQKLLDLVAAVPVAPTIVPEVVPTQPTTEQVTPPVEVPATPAAVVN